MAVTVSTRAFIPKGSAYLRRRASNYALQPVGNASALTFEITEETVEIPDYEDSGGGVADSFSRITGVTGTIDMRKFNISNVAIAVRGDSSTDTTTPITGETGEITSNSFLKFSKIPDPAVAPVIAIAVDTAATGTPYVVGDVVEPSTPNTYAYRCTVAGTSAGSAPTWPTTVGGTVSDGAVTWKNIGLKTLVADTDYVVKSGGVFIPSTATRFAVTAGTPLIPVTKGYTPLGAEVIEALLNSGYEYEMYFDGVNEASDDNPFTLTAHRVKFNPTAGFPVISESDFGTLSISFKLLKDSTITGASLSKYFKIGMSPG